MGAKSRGIAGAVLFTAGAAVAGAFLGAFAGTPPIRDAFSVPRFGAGAAAGALLGALLFVAGGWLMRRPGGASVRLGAALTGLVAGAFLGGMLGLGRVSGAVGGAVALGCIAHWAPPRESRVTGWRWPLASMLLMAVLFGVGASRFPAVREASAGGFLLAWALVGLPCAIFAGIAGLTFARHTAARPRLLTGLALLVCIAAVIQVLLNHAPLRTVHFPGDREVGLLRYNHWFDYAGRPARGDIRVPLRGAMFFQMHAGAADDLGFLASMPSLRELDLTAVAVPDEQVAHLTHLERLEFLSLAETPVSDAALEHLASLTRLRRLELEGAPVAGPGLAALRRLRRLEVLGLARTQVDDGAMEHVAALPALRDLSLYMTRVTDAGLEKLHACRTLRRLELYSTGVTETGVARLRERLPNCTVLY